MSSSDPPKPTPSLPLGQLMSELYEEYLALYDGDQDRAAVRTAATINRLLKSSESDEEGLPD